MPIGKFSSAEVLYIFAATLFGPSSDLWNDLGSAVAMHIGSALSSLGDRLGEASSPWIFVCFASVSTPCVHENRHLKPCTLPQNAQNMQSERVKVESIRKLRLVMCNTMAYILLALCDLDLIRIESCHFSEHSRQTHFVWGVALLTIAPDYTAFGSQRPKSRCLATMMCWSVLAI